MKNKIVMMIAIIIAMMFPLTLWAHGDGGSGQDCACSCGGFMGVAGGCTASGPCPCTCTCGIFSDSCTCGSVNIEQVPA